MKRLSSFAAALLIAANVCRAGLPDLSASISGICQNTFCVFGKDRNSEKSGGKLQTVSNASLFEEYNLSPDDYALVLSFNDSALEFVPLRASSGKPKVKVFAFGTDAAAARETRTKALIIPEGIAFGKEASPTAIQNASLRMIGQVTLTGTLAVAANLTGQQFKAAIYTVCQNPQRLSNASPMILQLTTGKVFTQVR
jgi:hypothetical protein